MFKEDEFCQGIYCAYSCRCCRKVMKALWFIYDRSCELYFSFDGVCLLVRLPI